MKNPEGRDGVSVEESGGSGLPTPEKASSIESPFSTTSEPVVERSEKNILVTANPEVQPIASSKTINQQPALETVSLETRQSRAEGLVNEDLSDKLEDIAGYATKVSELETE